MNGIIIAGGTVSLFYLLTKVINKHLLSVYYKSMIYYSCKPSLTQASRNIMTEAADMLANFLELFDPSPEFGVKQTYDI